MECNNCELKQRQFYCENCLRTHVRDFRLKTQHATKDRDEQVAKAKRLLQTVTDARERRADVANGQDRVQDVLDGLTQLRRQNDRTRERIKALRERLHMRRRVLGQAQIGRLARDGDPAHAARELAALSERLARARSGLVHELVEVFHVVEVGGRPPIGGKAGTKGEWTIGDLILPVPGDIRRYPPQHINAVITHTVHFLGLLTFYLGIKLPFEVVWSGKKLGVGQPLIGATKGAESGNWAKWHAKQSLQLSSAPPADAPAPAPAPRVALSESYVEDAGAGASNAFGTAFAMLLYNAAYLAHTQAVDVPLAHAGDVLSNLWAVCCSPELGRRSHETHPLLPPPTPPGFPLDFTQLLQATTANPRAKARRRAGRQEKIVEEDDGWDLVEDVAEGFA